MNDPLLDALVLWVVIPAGLLVCIVYLRLWRARRGWLVVQGVVRTPPDPRDPGALTEIGLPGQGGMERLVRLHLPAARGTVATGQTVTLSHPPGQPAALQPGTPIPLLIGGIAGGLMAALGLSILLGP